MKRTTFGEFIPLLTAAQAESHYYLVARSVIRVPRYLFPGYERPPEQSLSAAELVPLQLLTQFREDGVQVQENRHHCRGCLCWNSSDCVESQQEGGLAVPSMSG